MKNKGKKPLELYLHIPFCVKKCDYCDFLSGPSGTETRKAYTEALIREIQALPEHLDREVVSVFTGGGTPSLLDQKTPLPCLLFPERTLPPRPMDWDG